MSYHATGLDLSAFRPAAKGSTGVASTTAAAVPNLTIRSNGTTVILTPAQAVAAGYRWISAPAPGRWEKTPAAGGDRATVTWTKSARSYCAEKGLTGGYLDRCAKDLDRGCLHPIPGAEVTDLAKCISNTLARHPLPSGGVVRDQRYAALAAQCAAAGVPADQVDACVQGIKAGMPIEDIQQSIQQAAGGKFPYWMLAAGGAVIVLFMVLKRKKAS